ncbi:Ctr copper transporter family protein [Diplocarpon rosae]|nr:Ctr copper transporter family protein [Diplocarpon rosae]
MDHDMDMGTSECVVGGMLWNWNTINSCFISSTWHITSKGMFAGSCIGVVLLVMSLEFLRRLGKEYDRFIFRQYQRTQFALLSAASKDKNGAACTTTVASKAPPIPFRPNILQQVVRASIHAVSFMVAYFVMLLAMYYNGYIIICIMIGAWLGAFVFQWESVGLAGPEEEITMCCG